MITNELTDLLESLSGIGVDRRAIEKAKEIVAVLHGDPWQVVPGYDGDLQIELHTKEFDIEIHIQAYG